MKKIFKYEINESVAAKAAMNCVHKRLFKELYAFGSPMPQEEVSRGEYDPYEWEFDDYGNKDKRQLVLQALVRAGLIQSEQEGVQLNNKIQQLLDKTNFSVSNAQDAMKFVKAYGQQIVGKTQEQEEMEVTDAKQTLTQIAASELYYEDGDLDSLYQIISDILSQSHDIPMDEDDCYDWVDEHKDEIEEQLYSNPPQEQEEGDDKLAIAKQVMANYNPDTDEYEDPTVWLRYAIQEHIGKLFLKMPKKEVKAWQKVIDETIAEYEFEKQHPAHYEDEDEDNLQSQLSNAWDEGTEDDYVPYENKFDETHNDIVDNLISAVEYYFDTDDDVSGFYHHDYTEDQIGKAVEKVLDKYGDFPSSNNFNKCYAWTKKHVEELMKILETGSLENSYEGHPELWADDAQKKSNLDPRKFKNNSRKRIVNALVKQLQSYGISMTDKEDILKAQAAINDILDRTNDYPDLKSRVQMVNWCSDHHQEVARRIYR